MITYAELYELLRKEKYAEQLQQLPTNFFNEAASYFRDKKRISEKSDELFNESLAKTKKQLENAISILKELVTRRQKKVINIAFVASKTGISKRDSENMLEMEKKLFDSILKNLEEDDKVLVTIISGLDQGKDLKNQLVRFTQETGEFLGPNSKKLGPFKPGDIANLPQRIAEILVNSGKAANINEGQ